MDRAPGAVFGRYRIAAEPAYHGAGSLVAARELRTDEPRALWLLMPHVVSDPTTRAHVVEVATVLRRLRSPYLVRLHEFGEVDEQPFFALGSVHGLDLAELSDPDGFDPVTALDVIAQVGTGVDHLHHAGLVDGALGPRRVVVTEEDGAVRARLRDAGLLPVLLPTSALFGSQKQEALDFGAPELHHGEPPTVRSDVYSLGGMLWLALTGEAPFRSYVDHRAGEVPQVAGEGPLEEAVNAVLRKAMAKDPADRYRDAGAFVGTVRSIAALAREVGPEAVPARMVRLEIAEGTSGSADPEEPSVPVVDVTVAPVSEAQADEPAPTPYAGDPVGTEPEVVGASVDAGDDDPVLALARSRQPQPPPELLQVDDEVEPALRTAIDHWDERRKVSVRRRGRGLRGAVPATAVAAVLGAIVLVAVVAGRDGGIGPAVGGEVTPSPRLTASSAATTVEPLAELFPIAAKGVCVEDPSRVAHRLERWTCDRRGYRVVLTRWDTPSNAEALTPHGGPTGAREPWRLDGARAGTQWTWRAAREANRYRWTAVYDDVPYAVVIQAESPERRRHARQHVVLRPSTALG